MMRSLGFVGTVPAVVIAVVLLSGCAGAGAQLSAAATGDVLVVSEVPSNSVPLFLDTEPTEVDRLPIEAEFAGVDPGSSRYQGVWEGKDVFLAVKGESQVHIITGVRGDDSSWSAGATIGNSVIGLSAWDGEEISLQYVPHGTAGAPGGWTALSDFIIVKE